MPRIWGGYSTGGIFPSESEGGRHFHWVKKERKENGVTGYSPVILFSHTFLAFLRTLSFQQSKIFSHQLYELRMVSLCQVIAAWNHHGSALQGMRLPEKYQVNHL